MRVKRLEIQGFKSFKDKTVIHFDQGITGIVGPNGCGKSNIVDAFFWVMGEQSYKHMRGTGSEDLIFNGSSRYSPLGLAEATLVLETDAHDIDPASGATTQDLPLHLRSKEIAVTRRVYRSGEGEYFINGQPARLKDIQELFMDTGVGAKGYSVIEQGQIGKIVNAKPEERRLLVEEAAGIAKYKARKKESLRKMEATQGNLSRLNDVVQEIERNLGSLERQAQKARSYNKLRAELTDKEMTWGRRKARVIQQKLAELQSSKEKADHELAGFRAELQTVENSIEVDRVAQLTDSKAVEELQSSLQNARGELTREQSALELSRRRQGDLEEQLQNLRREQAELSHNIEGDRARLGEQGKELEEGEGLLSSAQARAQEQEELVRTKRQATESSRRSLEQAQRSLLQGVEQANELNARSAAITSRIESLREQLERIAGESSQASLRAEEDETRLAAARAELERLTGDRESLRTSRSEQQQAIRELEGTLRQQERAEDESLREVTRHRARLQSLRELVESHEGMGDGPKSLLGWARENGRSGVSPLTELVDVDAGFESAMEGWLEGRLEGLLSKDPALAVDALRELAARKEGRASIRLAGLWSARATDESTTLPQVEDLLVSAGFAFEGSLRQKVRANARSETQLADAALGACSHVAIVSNSAPLAAFVAGPSLEKLASLGWSLVSQDGIAIDLHAQGVAEIRGGSLNSDKSSSILGRKRAISELETTVESAEKLHAECQRMTEATRATLESARAALAGGEEKLRELEISCGTLDRETRQIERAAQEARQNLERLSSQRSRFEEDLSRNESELTNFSQQLAEIVSGRSELEARLRTDDERVHQLDLELRALESELQNLKVGEASVRERAQSLRREYQSLQGVVADRERRIDEIARILERVAEEQSRHSGGDGRSESRIEELTLLAADLESKLAGTKDNLEIVSSRVNAGLERIKALHKQGDSKNQESMGFALEIEKLNSDFAHLKQNLEEKYGPECLVTPAVSPIQEEMQEPVVTAEMTAEEEQILNEEVERLREKIRRLGEVNPMAEQEFNELQKRFEHLCTEKRDLERSLENLQEAIEHINKTSEERFSKAFEAIADRFEKLFPIIFGGGQAKLSLVYPEGSTDILDAGVDILAQPPGKKIVNMQALSGGEKALTAVSMIFAIFMVKPSPFCVLDEVDAPLDDANVGKFNALLREMSAKSQFILITHNKKTMELNDTLYGVTMEEPGVSKMVSVRMN